MSDKMEDTSVEKLLEAIIVEGSQKALSTATERLMQLKEALGSAEAALHDDEKSKSKALLAKFSPDSYL